MQTGVRFRKELFDSGQRQGSGGHAEANQIGRSNNDQDARPEQANRSRANAGPLAERQAHELGQMEDREPELATHGLGSGRLLQI